MGINKKIGFFPGVWDLVHVGHVRALKEAKQHCDYLVVGIKTNTTDQPEKNQPVMSVSERVEILLANKYVDDILIYDSERELYLIDADGALVADSGHFDFDIRFMGTDHKGKEHHPIKAEIVYISRDHNYSSTELRNRIKNSCAFNECNF